MSQCLRCSKPCEASAVFCDECRSLLRNEFRQGSVSRSSDSGDVASAVGTRFSASSLASSSAPSLVAREPDESQEDDPAHHSAKSPVIVETPRSPGSPVTPHPPVLDNYTYPDITAQTMSRLSEAAQLISEIEPSNRRLPRASRLAPIRDISADIRRESTPLPKLSKMRNGTGASEKVNTPGSLSAVQADAPESDHEKNGELPDLWPWFDNDIEEKENEDTWANSTDPLISRHIPNSVEAARIEEEDIKRALAEGMPTSHNLRWIRPRRASSLRVVFAVLAILAVLALIVDGILFSVVIVHPRRANPSPNGTAVAALTLSPSIVSIYGKYGKQQVKVQVHIMNFPPGHSVQLSHDLQETVKTVGSSSIITIEKNGSAEATLIVDDSWAVGFDQVYAEDIKTHFIASAQLQVIGKYSSSPAHLDLFDQNGKPVKSLDFGSVIQGSDKILPLTLKNSGSGSITWSASSNQSWLLVSPGQGIFSQSQKIDVAAQSINLKPGEHAGTLTLSSNVSAQPQPIKVMITVLAPPIPGSVLAPTPAVLSFTTIDGSKAPPPQALTLNNPGTQTLNWTLAVTASASSSNQLAFAHMQGIGNSWLSVRPDSGIIPAGSYQQLQVSVYSNSLLPGAYQGYLVFSAPGAVDGSSQMVAVSLTVQPHCGLVTNSGYLSFTAVQEKTNPSNQSLGLSATASCASISWKAALSSSYNWLSATPTSGTLNGTTSEFISVGANATGLPAATYYGFIALTTKLSTQTVMVALDVQPRPAPGAPVMSAAPLNLNFSNTYGQSNPKGQVVTITNTGASPLYWKTTVTQIVSSWLSASPTGSTAPVQPGQTGQLVVNINTSGLSPGTYAGQIGLEGRDSSNNTVSGSGQVVSINLVVQPACTLTQPSSSSLAFSGAQGGANPIAPTLLITGTGNCAWPLTLSFSAFSAPWLSAQFPTGNTIKASGQSVAFVVNADLQQLTSGPPISASFTISAIDSAGTVATGSPQQVTATLTVLPPCLPVVPPTLTFTAVQGQSSPMPQTVSLSEKNTCSYPLNWHVATGASWLLLSTPSADSGGGSSFTVSVNSAGLVANTYTGTITVSATDNNGRTVGAPQTITVTLNVTPPPTYTVSGTVIACSGPAPTCATSAPLPGATLLLFNSANVQVETITADPSGNYTFTNLLAGSYTVNITGTDASNVHYATSNIPLVVTTTVTGVPLDVYPG